jgi:hypothetical protein
MSKIRYAVSITLMSFFGYFLVWHLLNRIWEEPNGVWVILAHVMLIYINSPVHLGIYSGGGKE